MTCLLVLDSLINLFLCYLNVSLITNFLQYISLIAVCLILPTYELDGNENIDGSIWDFF